MIRNRVGKQIVNVPSFVVRLDSQKVCSTHYHLLGTNSFREIFLQHIDFALTSPLGGARAGRVKRKRAAAAANKEAGGDEEEEE